MNRKIKFRAWNGSSIQYEGFHISAPGIVWEWVQFPSNSKPVEYKIMQFTGLKDKNAIDIYEGDIIKSACGNQKDEVTFKNGSFFSFGEPIGFQEDDHQLTESNPKDWAIVIGNIYENPELLPNNDAAERGNVR